MKLDLMDILTKLTGAILILMIVALPFLAYYDIQRSKRLMQSCMADGHPEYYCRALVVR